MDLLQQKLKELQFLIDWKAQFQWSQVQKTVTSQDGIFGTEHGKAEKNGPPDQPHEARLQTQPGDARPERASLTMRVGVASRERRGKRREKNNLIVRKQTRNGRERREKQKRENKRKGEEEEERRGRKKQKKEEEGKRKKKKKGKGEEERKRKTGID